MAALSPQDFVAQLNRKKPILPKMPNGITPVQDVKQKLKHWCKDEEHFQNFCQCLEQAIVHKNKIDDAAVDYLVATTGATAQNARSHIRNVLVSEFDVAKNRRNQKAKIADQIKAWKAHERRKEQTQKAEKKAREAKLSVTRSKALQEEADEELKKLVAEKAAGRAAGAAGAAGAAPAKRPVVTGAEPMVQDIPQKEQGRK